MKKKIVLTATITVLDTLGNCSSEIQSFSKPNAHPLSLLLAMASVVDKVERLKEYVMPSGDLTGFIDWAENDLKEPGAAKILRRWADEAAGIKYVRPINFDDLK